MNSLKDMCAKYFRDPVHGYIRVDDDLLRIVDHPLFQRLRRIKETGWGFYAYHGMTHSRFEHSLGAFHLMEKVIENIDDNFRREYGYRLDELTEQASLLKLKALLHDIGHLPFSHSFEMFRRSIKYAHLNHAVFSRAIIRYSELGELIRDIGFEPSELLAPHPLNSLLDSNIDVDKMDYLKRDALHAGVLYGAYDLKRLLLVLTLTPNLKLAVLKKGIEAVEHFIMARYYMYLQVYFHKVKCSCEAMFHEILLELLDTNSLVIPPPDAIFKDKVSIEFLGDDVPFCFFDDVFIEWALRSITRKASLGELRRRGADVDKLLHLASSLIGRRHYRLVFEADDRELIKLFLERGLAAFDEVLDYRYQSLLQVSPLPLLYYIAEAAVYVPGESSITVVESGEEKGLLEELSSIVGFFKGKMILKLMFFADPKILNKVREVIKRSLSRTLSSS
ncbi:MAG: hypothetical protein DRN15_08155 [Thermoprotei archaeon]|nr:MAG: hypothetical protein DRN15_08155 [Thermoprotei archaeon]